MEGLPFQGSRVPRRPTEAHPTSKLAASPIGAMRLYRSAHPLFYGWRWGLKMGLKAGLKVFEGERYEEGLLGGGVPDGR